MSSGGGGVVMEVLPSGLERRLRRLGRWVMAVALGGAVGAVVFLIMVQGSYYREHTEMNFNHALGEMMGGARGVAREREAFGVVGDAAGPTGLWSTLLLGVLLVLVHSLTSARLVRRPWFVQTIPLWLFTFLLLGLVFGPLTGRWVDDTPGGVMGLDAGGRTPLVLAMSALGFAVVASRVYSLVITARWWEDKHEGLEQGLASIADLEGPAVPTSDAGAETGPAPVGGRAGRAGSFELPEERPEDGGVGPRG